MNKSAYLSHIASSASCLFRSNLFSQLNPKVLTIRHHGRYATLAKYLAMTAQDLHLAA